MSDAQNNVDMLAEAREAQWSALSFMGEDAIKLVAPAKVNLFLGVGQRRPDGYHDVVNVMHALALHDNIYMCCHDVEEEVAGTDVPASPSPDMTHAGPEGSLAVSIEMVDKTQMLAAPGSRAPIEVPAEDNLVFKAIDMLARELGIEQSQEISVRVEKHVPMQAGLGGGSADAAAALVGMAHFWGLSDSGKTLHAVASRLGADVAFFLEGGCGLFTGTGDVFERRLDPMKDALVLVKPDVGVSTAECYAAFDADPVPVPADLLAQAEDAGTASEVPLFNNLAPAACSIAPQLAEVAEWLADATRASTHRAERPDLNVARVLLSGSGSATYAIVDSYAEAARIAGEANARGWWARATSFSSLRALKV